MCGKVKDELILKLKGKHKANGTFIHAEEKNN